MGNLLGELVDLAEKEATVTEKLLTDSPWRTVGTLDKQLTASLLSDIKGFKTGHKVKNVRLLVLGPVGAGKSSFINSVASIDVGCMTAPVEAGTDKSSLTRKLAVYRPDTRLQGFRLIDTMGVEEAKDHGFHVKDAANIINGHLRPDFKFDHMSAADESNPSFVKHPKIKEKAHCVLYFMDARILYEDNVTDATKAKITGLQNEIKDIGVKQILIITNIDRLCPKVRNDLGYTFSSRRVHDAVKAGQNMFGLPEMNIFPVENYHNDVELDFKKDILLLYALRQAMMYSKAYLKMDAQREGNESSDED